MIVWVIVGALRGRFIGAVAVRVGAGIGNDKDRTMRSSTESNRPGVLCHRGWFDSERKVTADEVLGNQRGETVWVFGKHVAWNRVVVAHTLALRFTPSGCPPPPRPKSKTTPNDEPSGRLLRMYA